MCFDYVRGYRSGRRAFPPDEPSLFKTRRALNYNVLRKRELVGGIKRNKKQHTNQRRIQKKSSLTDDLKPERNWPALFIDLIKKVVRLVCTNVIAFFRLKILSWIIFSREDVSFYCSDDKSKMRRAWESALMIKQIFNPTNALLRTTQKKCKDKLNIRYSITSRHFRARPFSWRQFSPPQLSFLRTCLLLALWLTEM